MKSKSFEKKLINLNTELRLLQWENYASNENHDLNKINIKIYNLFNRFRDNNLFTGRKRELFERLYPKYIVENDPKVTKLRNKLDERKNYIEDSYKKKNENNKVKIARRMKKDVVELINIRNSKAKNMGFSSYPDLVFYSEELKKKTLVNDIKCYLENNIDIARKLIKKYDLTWTDWFKKIRNIGDFKKNNIESYINCLFSKLGMDNKKNNIFFKIKDQEISGVAFGISIPNDIRLLMKPVFSLYDVHILFHECGHAINYVSNKESGLYTIYTKSFDEIMATLFESIGIQTCLDKQQRTIINEIKKLEAVRCCISFLFEMELWKNTDKAEKLFRKYQLRLPMVPAPEEIWVLDTFRYIDPVYIHNYVLGELYSKKIITILNTRYGEDYENWGSEINKIFLQNGMKKSLKDKYNEFIKNSR